MNGRIESTTPYPPPPAGPERKEARRDAQAPWPRPCKTWWNLEGLAGYPERIHKV